MKKYIILIPSCGELSPVMQAETGCKFPVYIQIGSRPLYYHILKSYSHIKDVSKFVFLLPEESPKLNLGEFVGYDIETKELTSSQSISQTIMYGIIEPPKEQILIVHMGDTIISPFGFDLSDTVYVKNRTDLYRWTCISKDAKEKTCLFIDRDEGSFGESKQVCVGVFVFSDLLLFSTLLNSEISTSSRQSEAFFNVLQLYSSKREVQLIEPEIWHDFGHIDTYYESRLNFHNLRFFNTLSYDSELGKVTKKSNNINSFRHQVRWFKQVPDEFNSFLPRIYESSDGENPFITMELLTIPSLSELYTSNRLEIGAWDNVAKKISSVLSSFVNYKHESKTTNCLAKEIYSIKTRQRVVEFLSKNSWAKDLFVNVNEKSFSLVSVLENLDEYIYKFELLDVQNFVPIHGDLCFSNIMYDIRSNQIKLIDPRGEFGTPGIFGDQLYDKAKLMHSYLGHYDFILSGDFHVQVKSGELFSDFILPVEYGEIEKIFSNRLFSSRQEEEKCNAVMSLLFLSMLPLHSDNKDRQLAMMYVGIKYFASNYLKYSKWQ
jgi:hypothetical protein